MEEGLDTVCCSTCSLAIRVLYRLADEEVEEKGEGEEEGEGEGEGEGMTDRGQNGLR